VRTGLRWDITTTPFSLPPLAPTKSSILVSYPLLSPLMDPIFSIENQDSWWLINGLHLGNSLVVKLIIYSPSHCYSDYLCWIMGINSHSRYTF
jgi:hypothetical protein